MTQTFENVREKIYAIAGWLGDTHETISYGLRSISDAEKLYDYGQTREADEYPDQWPEEELEQVLGYNPWKPNPADQPDETAAGQ